MGDFEIGGGDTPKNKLHRGGGFFTVTRHLSFGKGGGGGGGGRSAHSYSVSLSEALMSRLMVKEKEFSGKGGKGSFCMDHPRVRPAGPC